MLYVTNTLLNMYLILFRFIASTNHWLEKFVYSTRHIISRYSAALWLIQSAAEPRPQRLGFPLGPQFDIRYRQVELVQLFIQILCFLLSVPFHKCSIFMQYCVFYLLYDLSFLQRLSMKYSNVSLLRMTARNSVQKEVSCCSKMPIWYSIYCIEIFKIIGRTTKNISV